MSPDIVYLHTSLDSKRVSSLWASMYSVKRVAPEARLRCIVVDSEASELISRTPPILAGQIEWVAVDVPEGTPAYRSRWIKTQLVKWLNGPSLYLDSDTLAVKPLAWDELTTFSFATAPNRVSDQEFKERPTRINDIKKFAVADWVWDSRLDEFYGNSGVMYITPNRRVEAIFSEWHKKWLEFYSLTGDHVDQPSLNVVLLELGWCERLPCHWNAPVRAIPWSFRGAYIHHYYSSLDAHEDGRFTLLWKLVQMMQESHFDSAAANSLLKRAKVYVALGGRIKGYLLAGQYFFALRAILRKCLRRGPVGKK